jgi:hypothetical protein
MNKDSKIIYEDKQCTLVLTEGELLCLNNISEECDTIPRQENLALIIRNLVIKYNGMKQMYNKSRKELIKERDRKLSNPYTNMEYNSNTSAGIINLK